MEPEEKNIFLDELDEKNKEEVFEQSNETEKSETEEETNEKTDEDAEILLKNRREKRLNAKLQAEKESNIQLNERLKVISESQRSRASDDDESLKSLQRIYGQDSPEAIEATNILVDALSKVKESAKEEALNAMKEQRVKEVEEMRGAERELETIMEDIEDTYNIDMTSDNASAVRKDFITLLERMSPKDVNGDVIQYADPIAVWETYQLRTANKENKAKDLSSRSMVKSGTSKETTIKDDATERFLKENGII